MCGVISRKTVPYDAHLDLSPYARGQRFSQEPLHRKVRSIPAYADSHGDVSNLASRPAMSEGNSTSF